MRCRKPLAPMLLALVAAAAAAQAGAPALEQPAATAQPGAPDQPSAPASPPAISLTLAQAIARARAASARLAALAALEDAAAAGRDAARAARLPQIELSAGYTRNSEVPELRLFLPGVGLATIFPSIPDNYRTHLGVSLPLYTGGRTSSSIAAAESQRLAAGKDREGGSADLALETTAAYWNLVTARENARVLAEAVAAYDAHVKSARDRQEVGMAARNEVLAVSVQRDSAELARLQAENAAALANANLLRLLDLPAGARVDPGEPLGTPGENTASASAESAAALGSAALAARPELAAARHRVAAAAASERTARAAAKPQASLAAAYDYANPNLRILPATPQWKGTWSVGASVSLNLFDGGRTAAAAAQLAAQAEAARHQLTDLEQRVRLEVTSRLLDLASARKALEVAARNVEAARENLRVARDRYHEGVIPSSELLDAETALLRAGLEQTSSLAEVRIALANLARAVGR